MRFSASALTAALMAATSSATVVQTVVNRDDLTTLETAVLAAGLEVALGGAGPFTVFAPDDDAFAALPAGLVDKLVTDPWTLHLTDILTYHVANVNLPSSDVIARTTPLEMLNGETISFAVDNGNVVINGDSTITTVDLTASNGIVHVIDTVLQPTFLSTSIVDVALVQLPTLAELVVIADLDGTLSTTDGLTVFAPSEEAFAALPAATLDTLKTDEGKDMLVDILTYHVHQGVVASAAIPDGDSTLSTLQGSDLDINKNAETGAVMVNDANVIVADVLANNGIIHVIDAVLMPPASSAPTTAPPSAPTAAPSSAPTAAPSAAPAGPTMAMLVALLAVVLPAAVFV